MATKALEAQRISLNLPFDLETFMIMSGNRRLESEKAREIEQEWLRLFSYLTVYRLGQKKGYLVIFFNPGLEQEIDTLAETDPEKAEQSEIIIHSLMMTSMCEILPDAHVGSCAPVPEPNKILKRSLQNIGLELASNGQLNVRYGVLTKLPYNNDCAHCALKSTCIKRILQSE